METSSYRVPIDRLQLVKESETVIKPICGPNDLAEQMQELATADREQMVCIHLNTKNRLVGQQTVSVGILNHALIHPRELFKGALLSNAFNIVLAHNHPSGDVTPSREDDMVTVMVAKAGKLLGIPLLDHVILSPDGSFCSYSEMNPQLLKEGDLP